MTADAPGHDSVIAVVGAAILRGDRCLATQRSSSMSMPLRWEFPGGKLEQGESPRAALRRELREELEVEVEVGALLARGESTVGHRTIRLDVYLAGLAPEHEPIAREHGALGWFTADQLLELRWPDADRPALSAVCELLRGRKRGLGMR